MKWDVKHDRAKRVIDAFLDNAAYWPEREDLAEGLTEEEKELVGQEVAVMIASIRKRYKLEERLPEVPVVPEETPAEKSEPIETSKEEVTEPVEEVKPKRGRKASCGDKKVTEGKTARKPRAKKEEVEQ